MTNPLTTGSRAASLISEHAHLITALSVLGLTALLFMWQPKTRRGRR